MVGFWTYFERVNRISYGLDIREKTWKDEVVIQWFREDYKRSRFGGKSRCLILEILGLTCLDIQVELLRRQLNKSLKFGWKGLDWRCK